MDRRDFDPFTVGAKTSHSNLPIWPVLPGANKNGIGRKKTNRGREFSADTLEFIRLLEKHSVQYVIVGGQAGIFHGYARFTGHVDFFYSTRPENTDALFCALLEFWDGNIPGISTADELRQPATVIQFGRPPNRIDLLTSIDGVTFEDAWSTREILIVRHQSLAIETSVLSFPKLIQNKQASGRPKDLDDLHHLTGNNS